MFYEFRKQIQQSEDFLQKCLINNEDVACNEHFKIDESQQQCTISTSATINLKLEECLERAYKTGEENTIFDIATNLCPAQYELTEIDSSFLDSLPG